MNKCCGLKCWRDAGLLGLRLTLGIMFMVMGYGKLTHMSDTITAFAGFGFPAAAFCAYLVSLVEFIGGLAVILGVYVRIAAKLLGIILVVAILAVHVRMGHAFQMWALPFVALGGCLALMGVGGGAYQISKKECFCGKMSGCEDKKGLCGSDEKKSTDEQCCGGHAEKMANGDVCCKK